jgi:DNA helicase-4
MNKAVADEILILAFNNKAALEISSRAALLKLPVQASTFHKFEKDMLEENSDRRVVAFSEAQQVDQFFETEIKKMHLDSILGLKLVAYFAAQLVPVKDHQDYNSLNEYTAYVKSMPKTLQGEKVKSHGEWLIANFLWSMSVKYEYEAIYTPKIDLKGFHKPDFFILGTKIYIEYFGVS